MGTMSIGAAAAAEARKNPMRSFDESPMRSFDEGSGDQGARRGGSQDQNPAPVRAAPAQAGVRKTWDGRECDQCGLTMHESDARFCRRCAARLPATEETAQPLFVRRERPRRNIVGSRRLPMKASAPARPPILGGRLGMDITQPDLDNQPKMGSIDQAGKAKKRRQRRSMDSFDE